MGVFPKRLAIYIKFKYLKEKEKHRNEYIETERPIVIVTAPGPGSGKMATCLSQLYNENKTLYDTLIANSIEENNDN